MTRPYCARRIGLALGVWVTVAPGPVWADPSADYLAIQRAFLAEQFDAVAALAPGFLTQHPQAAELPKVSLWLALSFDRLQQPDRALQELERLKRRLSQKDPLWPEALYWDGEISRRAFQMVRATAAYQRLLDRYPDSSWVLQSTLGLGLIALHQQAFQPAIGYFRDVAEGRAGSALALEAQTFQGLCHVRLGQFPEAAGVLQPLLDQLQDPTALAQAAFYLGESLTGLERYRDAAAAYERAVNTDRPSQWRQLAQFGLGWAQYRAGRCHESIRAFESYLAQRGAEHGVEALFAQGSCYARLGREDQALARFERILSTQPNHPLALQSGLALADGYRRQDRPALAKSLLHSMLMRRPDDDARAQIQLKLGTLALEEGNAAQAQTVFKLAREHPDPTTRQTAISGLADVQMFLGNLKAARELYEEAVKVDERSSLADYASYQVGRVSLQLGAPQAAIPVYQRLMTSDDSSVADEAHLALAVAYLNNREPAKAQFELEVIRQTRTEGLVAGRAAYYEALLALARGEEAQAERLCHRTIAAAPRTDEALEARLLLANLRGNWSQPVEVARWLRRAYVKEPLPMRHRARLAKRIAEILQARQLYADAMRWYDEAARLLPSLRGEAGYQIASCYEEAGDVELALRWYERVEQAPWRVRGRLAMAKLLERDDRVEEAEAVYEQLAKEPIPEAKIIQERLADLRGARFR